MGLAQVDAGARIRTAPPAHPPETTHASPATVVIMTTPQQPNQPPYSPQGQPQQQYPQQYSAPPQAPGYPTQIPGHPAQARASSGGKGLAWTAILIAVFAVLAGPFISAGHVLAQGGDLSAIGTRTAFGALAIGFPLLLAIIGTVLAGIALRGSAKALAGAGLGANLLLLLSVLVNSFLTPLLYTALL